MVQGIGGIITVERVVSVSTPDLLAGTQLDQPGLPGVYTIFVQSTVTGNSLNITQGGQTITANTDIPFRTNAEIRENEDGYYQMLSRTGGRPVINITRTAGDIRTRVRFLPA